MLLYVQEGPMAYKNVPPPIPSKKDPSCKKHFLQLLPCLRIFFCLFESIYFLLLANPDFKMFPAKTYLFHFTNLEVHYNFLTFLLKLCYSTVSVALQSGSGAQLESKEGGFSGNRRHHYFSKTSTLFLEEHQHYFLKNINTIS